MVVATNRLSMVWGVFKIFLFMVIYVVTFQAQAGFIMVGF